MCFFRDRVNPGRFYSYLLQDGWTAEGRVCITWGPREAFTPDADFSALSAGSLIADAMIHQAKIEVDRNDARASAATAIILYGCCLPEEVKHVIIDRPFVFAVLNRELEILVFFGVVNHMDPVR